MNVEQFVKAFGEIPADAQLTVLTRCQEVRNARIKATEKEREAEANAAWALISRQFEWRATPKKWQDWVTKEPRDGVHVWRRVRPDLYAAFKAKYGERSQADKWDGMQYIRTSEGVLTDDGGGMHILKVPLLCPDEDWALILAGKIPERYIH